VGKGIQKGVAICQLEKSFFIFKVKLVPNSKDLSNSYLKNDYDFLRSPENRIYNINDYPKFSIEID